MLSILFWNLMGNQADTWEARSTGLRTHLGRFASSLGIDVLLLAESAFDPAEIVDVLDGSNAGKYCFPVSNSRRIQLFTRLPASAVVDQFDDSSTGRLTIRRLTTPASGEILLASLHFQSRMAWTSDEQDLEATIIPRDISAMEDIVGHQRTVLIGDFNMDPFDLGIIGAQAFNAVMTRDLAQSEARTVAGRSYRFFYNPMWGCFGDRTPGPPGTHFYQASSPGSHYWHIFDQVLLRPTLMHALDRIAYTGRRRAGVFVDRSGASAFIRHFGPSSCPMPARLIAPWRSAMSITAIPDCWSDDIKVNVLSPIAVLKAQEGFLARKTQGMLQAKSSTVVAGDLVQHQLDLIAPSLNFYQVRVLSATHRRDMLYPVTVRAECFAPKLANPLQRVSDALRQTAGAIHELAGAVQGVPDESADQRVATTQEEFVSLIREVLRSAEVRSLIDSLLARINQEKEGTQGNGTAETGDEKKQGEKGGN